MAYKLTFTSTTAFEITCESEWHAVQVAESLSRWSERENHRIEPMNRSVSNSFTIEPVELSPIAQQVLDEVSESKSRVNP